MIISDFKWRIWVTLLLALVFVTIFLQCAIHFDSSFTAPEGGIIVLFIIVFVIWMLFYDIRTKIISVVFEEGVMSVKRWLGFGREKQYLLEEITGYMTSVLRGRAGDYKIIYIISEDNKVAKISEFYHANFTEIETFITIHLKNIGKINTDIFSEVRDSMR